MNYTGLLHLLKMQHKNHHNRYDLLNPCNVGFLNIVQLLLMSPLHFECGIYINLLSYYSQITTPSSLTFR